MGTKENPFLNTKHLEYVKIYLTRFSQQSVRDLEKCIKSVGSGSKT